MRAASPRIDTAGLASDLRDMLGRLVRRLRAQSSGLPFSQGVVLGRLDREGPRTVSELAAAERVRPQSMAQTVGELEAIGLVARRPDPDDRRRALVELTPQGTERLHASRRDRESWLARAIERDLDAEERVLLHRAAELLRRLADSAPE